MFYLGHHAQFLVKRRRTRFAVPVYSSGGGFTWASVVAREVRAAQCYNVPPGHVKKRCLSWELRRFVADSLLYSRVYIYNFHAVL